MEDCDPFNLTSLVQSRYWPGSIDNITYLIDEDLLMFFDKLKAFMPGTSESAFLKGLENMPKERKRVMH